MRDRTDDNHDLAHMRAAIRAHDWAKTSLGPMHTWPSSLAACVDLMLASPAQISIYWGPDHLLLYNDSCRELLGAKHPAALGRSAREVLPEIWDQLGPMLADVFASGEAVDHHARLLPINRAGHVEDAWFDCALSPILAEDGSVGGLFSVTVEVTDKVRAQAQLRAIGSDVTARKPIEHAEQESRARLVESEEKFRTAFQTAPIVLVVTSLENGRWIEVNDTFEQVMGYAREEIVGRSSVDVGLWPDPEVQRELAARLAEHGFIDQVEVSPRAKNGELKTVMLSATMITVDGVRCALSSWVDVTERRRAEQDLRRAHGLIEGVTQGTQDMIAALDLDFRFLFFNEALRREHKRLWGEDAKLGAGGLDPLTRWPEEHRKAQEMWTRALEGESFIVTQEFGPSDEKQTYELRFSPLKDDQGRLFGAAQIFRDVTEKVRTQQALSVANEELQAVSQRKDDYLAMLGHELRNPLAAIWSATELIKLRNPEDPRSRRAATVLERQSNHMAQLIDGLLEVSRIARGKIDLQPHPLDLRELIERVVEDRQDQFDNRGLQLETQLAAAPVWTSGDRVRLAQVFDNLIGNALKFTQAPGLVTVTLHEHDDCALVRVRDTGIGIRPKMLSTIFEPFRQESQSIARTTGGLGLGLALAKGLVELHGGTITARSDGLGAGAEFHVRLPLTCAPPEVRSSERTTGAEARRILVVEDNLDVAEMLRDVLELFGHEVTTADNGEGALAIMRAQAVDLVLCDLGLPGISGYELARLVRADESLGGLPLVAVSGYGQAEDRRQAAEAGFDAHLVKPVSIKALEQTLREFEPRPHHS